MKLNKCWIN